MLPVSSYMKDLCCVRFYSQSDLEANEVHRQLSSLEKKWAMLEESNFSVSSFLKAKKAETDYEDLKTEALTVLKELNNMLQIK